VVRSGVVQSAAVLQELSVGRKPQLIEICLQEGEAMSKTTGMYEMDCFSLPVPDMAKKRNAQGLSTDDFRRLLSELKQRALSQRPFLRKLLHRAIANGAPTEFPVLSHVVPDPVGPS
jgi:hypothetical protein